MLILKLDADSGRSYYRGGASGSGDGGGGGGDSGGASGGWQPL